MTDQNLLNHFLRGSKLTRGQLAELIMWAGCPHQQRALAIQQLLDRQLANPEGKPVRAFAHVYPGQRAIDARWFEYGGTLVVVIIVHIK